MDLAGLWLDARRLRRRSRTEPSAISHRLLGFLGGHFTQRKLVALALGGGFQFLMLGLALTLMRMALL